MLGWESNKVLKKRSITTVYQNTEKEKRNSPRPGIEPGPSTWQAEILTTRLSRNCCKRLKCFTTCYQLTAFSTVQSLVCVYSLKLHGQEKKGYVSILDKEFLKKKITPSSRIWTSDLWITVILTTTVHRSTNWAIASTDIMVFHFDQLSNQK